MSQRAFSKSSPSHRRLLRRVPAASLGPMIAAVVVNRNLHVGFLQLTGVRQTELLILDVQSPLYPHALVIGLDGQYLARFGVKTLGVVKVFRAEEHRQMVQAVINRV